MPSWSLPGSDDKTRLLAHAETALPRWFSKSPRGREDLNALADMFAGVLAQVRDWVRMTYIQDSDGKWLRQHAKDRGTGPQEDESEEALKARLIDIEDAVTRPVILAAIQAIMDAAGVAGSPAMVELRRDDAFFGTYTQRAGTGGVFAAAAAGGGLRSFLPDVPFATPVRVGAAATESGMWGNPRLVISGAASAGNNGTFEVTALEGDAAVFTNASAVDGDDSSAAWALRKTDVDGNNREGRARAYLGRGYRMAGPPGSTIIIILPFGTPTGVAEAAREIVRRKKAGGIKHVVEVRGVP